MTLLKRYFLGLILVATVGLSAAEQDACQLMKNMIDYSRHINTLEFTMKTRERMDGVMVDRSGFFRIQRQPVFRVFYERGFPDKGAVVLYNAVADSQRITVKPNTFPWVSVTLDRNDWLVRKGGHHTVDQAGFDYTLDILDFILQKYGKGSCDFIRFGMQSITGDVSCRNVELDNPHFKWIDYTLQEDENVTLLAARLRLSDYMILRRNPQFDKFSNIHPGMTIKIPTDYAQRMVVCVDDKTGLPAFIQIFDDQGLFEEYEFVGMKINPELTDNDFIIP